MARRTEPAFHHHSPVVAPPASDSHRVRRLANAPDLAGGVKAPPEQGMIDLVQIFQALADLTRVKVVFALTAGERNVNDIADQVGASPSAVSHHLRRLKDAGLVTFHRHGNQVFYSIEDIHIAAILREASNHIDHTRLGSQLKERK